MFKWLLMLVSMSDDCCECVMTLTLTFREHQRVTRTGWQGGEVTAWQETQLWQRAGHRIRTQQRQSPWTTTRKQHNWHCAPQVPRQCPGPQCLACVCDHDWFGNIYNQKTWLIASCPAPTTTPTLPLNFESHHTHGWLATWAGDSSWLNLKILTIFQWENECKEAKVPNGPMELF